MKRVQSTQNFCCNLPVKAPTCCCHCCCTCNPQQSKPITSGKLSLGSGQFLSSRLKLTGQIKRPIPKFVQGARVKSCAKVFNDKNHQSKAQPFYYKQKDLKPLSSTYYQSWSHQVHRMHPDQHVGSQQKILLKYKPEANRNRVRKIEEKYLESNASQIQIGNKKIPDGRHFLTTYRNNFCTKFEDEPVSNIGILCNRTIWRHRQQQK